MVLNKRNIIISTVIVLVLAGLVGLIWLKVSADKSKMNIVNPYELENIFKFDVKDKNLTSEKIDEYFKAFNESKNTIINSPEQFHYQSFMTLGIIKKIIGDLEGARDIWLYVSSKRPENSMSFGNLGDLYTNFLKDPEKAEENLKIAINNSKGESFNINYCRNLFDLYTYSLPDKKILRETVLLDCLKDNPESVDLYTLLAGYYLEINDQSRALDAYQKALTLDPNNAVIKAEIKKLK